MSLSFPLKKCAKEIGLYKGTILTFDVEGKEMAGYVEIGIVPVN